jgi:DNA helicase-2/ATP-dependent DNA helicase PcrA
MAEKKINKEQLKAIKHGQGPLIIIAGAGTGKTMVITERIKWLINQELAKPSEILALTFTDKAAREMEERVDRAVPYGYTQMWISTFHSFCDRILRDEAVHIGLDPGFILMTEAEALIFLKSHLFNLPLNYFRPRGNPTKFLEGLLQHFNRLRDEDISASEYLRWAQAKSKKRKAKSDKEEIKKILELAKAFKKYQALKIKEGVMDFADLISNALRLFREKPNILRQYQEKFKYVLVDEFQDTNISQNELAILLAGPPAARLPAGQGRAGKKANITVTGDDDQCLPPGAKIATPREEKKIKDIQAGDEVITAVGKGYTSISKVIHVEKNIKKARFLTFTTEKGTKITVTDNHKMFCLVPPRVYGKKDFYYVYLMHRRGLGWRMGVTNDLAQRLKLERSADRITGIKACHSEQEARYHETLYSLKYRLPTVPFKARKGMAITDKWLEQLYSEIDSEKNAQKLAADLNVDLNAHHYCLLGVVRGGMTRVKINLRICKRRHRTKWARGRFLLNPHIWHQVNLVTSDKITIKRLQKANIKIQNAKKGKRVRKIFASLTEAGKFAQKLVKITGGILSVKFDVAKRNDCARQALVLPAKNVLLGHSLPVLKGYKIIYEKIVNVKEMIRKAIVYDLEIDKTHNFIADGVVVHNSIYRFRGAAVSNIIQFRQQFPKAKLVVLTRNYRSTKTILDHAYQLIQYNNPDRLEIKEKINKKLTPDRGIKGENVQLIRADRVENEAEVVTKEIKKLVSNGKYTYKDFAILVRANDHAHPFSQALARVGIPFQFLGPGQLLRQPEVKDLIAYLKVLYNFEDNVALFRVLTMDIFDLSARDLAAIRNFSRKYNLSFFEGCEEVSQEESARPRPQISQKSRQKINQIIKMIHRHLKLIPKESAGQILYFFLEESGLLQELTEYKTVTAERRTLNISKFFDKLKTYETEHEDASIFPVVDWLNMKMTIGESPLASDADWTEINAVNILTVHSAKGLEFPVVFLVNLVSQRFPTIHRREQIPLPEELIKEILPSGDYHEQEERRLFYVGMTRAKDRLYFTAASYYGEGKREKKISAFVFEAMGKIPARESERKTTRQLSFLDFQPAKEKPSIPHTPYSIPLTYLSYSQINVFNTCPLQYKYKYILKIPVPASAAQTFGSSVHAALRDFYQMVSKKKKKPRESNLLKALEKNWSPIGYASKTHEKKMFNQAKKMLKDYFQKSYHPQETPLALEKTFSFRLNDQLKMRGIFDRVDQLKSGQIEVIDYKTGKPKTKKELKDDLQMTVYALAVTDKGIYAKKPEEVILSFYFLGSQKKVTSKRSVEQLKAAKKEIIKKAAEIQKSDFLPTPSKLCDFCEYKLLCEAWR